MIGQWTRRRRDGFKTDGCTMWPDHDDFFHCCVAHDWYYWNAGLHGKTRREVDREMRRCVIASGHPISGRIMYVGVRLFGWLLWNRNVRYNVRYR